MHLGSPQVGIPRRLNSKLVGIVPVPGLGSPVGIAHYLAHLHFPESLQEVAALAPLQETLLQQAAMRAQRNVPISAKGAALAQLAELKRSGVKRSDQFEVPHRAHPICGRPADTRPSCLIR